MRYSVIEEPLLGKQEVSSGQKILLITSHDWAICEVGYGW